MKGIGAKIAGSTLAIILLSTIFASFAAADGGIISPYTVYEYAQSAVIAWNDGREYLCLEVGLHVYFKEQQEEIKALRIVPFPSLPQVLSGDERLFKKVLDFVKSRDRELRGHLNNMLYYGEGKSASGGGAGIEDVIYYGSVYVGPHTVGLFRIRSAENMNEKVKEVFRDMGIDYQLSLDPYGKSILERYIKSGYDYFAFDVLTIKREDTAGRRTTPVAYIFNTSKIYYPVEITFLSPGHYRPNTIALYVITPHGVDLSSTNFEDFKLERRYRISGEELREMNEDIASMVPSGYLDVFLGEGIERGVETWNFEARENAFDPYLWEMIPFFAAFAVVAALSALPFFLGKKRKKSGRGRKMLEQLSFGAVILLLMVILYLLYLHYLHLNQLSDIYSSVNYQNMRSYYHNQLYIAVALSLVLLILHFRIRERHAMLLTLLAVLLGVIVALEYVEYISIPIEVFGMLVALFLIIVVPHELGEGFTTKRPSFQKKLSLALGIPIFIFAFIPGLQVVDMGFSALFMGLSYLRGEIKFGTAPQEKE